FEVTAQRGLTLDIDARLRIGWHFLQHLYVGLDALGLDRTAGRREVPGRGQPQRPLVGTQRDDGLHGTLAKRTCANKGGALVILQRTGNDFRGRSRAAIDQHDQRLALGQIARVGVVALGLLSITATGRDDLAPVEEPIRDRNRLIEQATRIVTQVDDEALDLVGAELAG